MGTRQAQSLPFPSLWGLQNLRTRCSLTRFTFRLCAFSAGYKSPRLTRVRLSGCTPGPWTGGSGEGGL